MKAALKVLHDSITMPRKSSNPVQSTNAVNIVQQEWFKISSTKGSNPLDVDDYLDFIELEMSKELLSRIVNLTDVNGNTALHYSVSHGNFDVVSVLLDSKVANPTILNKAGYTCIMLISLAQINTDTNRAVVRRLFSLGDINVRGSQHGQTALMLAVSHGRLEIVQLLVESGADLNIRDEDGSSALMCAAEHGQVEIVKFLLAQPDTDIFAKDNDGLTALAVAMEAGHRDLGVILYANMSMSRGTSPYSSMRLRPSAGGSRTSTPSGSAKSKGATPPRSPIAPTPPLP
jgi:ankyrin repeat protein